MLYIVNSQRIRVCFGACTLSMCYLLRLLCQGDVSIERRRDAASRARRPPAPHCNRGIIRNTGAFSVLPHPPTGKKGFGARSAPPGGAQRRGLLVARKKTHFQEWSFPGFSFSPYKYTYMHTADGHATPTPRGRPGSALPRVPNETTLKRPPTPH